MFVDTHCHLFKEYYDSIEDVIKDSCMNEVKYYINNGCDQDSNEEVLDCAKKHDNVYAALGIHPESVETYTLDDIKFIEDNLSNDKVVAIGEIGLDYHYTKENKDEQIKLFEMQLALAEKYDLPVIVHSRDATEDTINSLKKFKVKGTIHSFSGSIETAKIYLKMGFILGINGVVTFKNAHLKDVVKEVGLQNIVLETDSPYLTPEPFRGTKNSPAHVLDIAKYIASLYDISLEELSNITNENVKRTYKKIHI